MKADSYFGFMINLQLVIFESTDRHELRDSQILHHLFLLYKIKWKMRH